MRHASITTTMNIYGRLLPNELTDATTSIGPMFGAGAVAALKTGTDDRPINVPEGAGAQRARRCRTAQHFESAYT